MPRKSINKTEIPVSKTESTEVTVIARKGRGSARAKEETTEGIKIETKSPSRSKKQPNYKQETDSEDEEILAPKKTSAKLKGKAVKASEPIKDEEESKPKKAPAKRKAKAEDDTEEGGGKKAPKKRKTKEDKEAEAMPVAARTLVSSLKKAMYIGAHVSGAGGISTVS